MLGHHECATEINDTRLTNDERILAVRTRNRFPAGLDLVDWNRPEANLTLDPEVLRAVLPDPRITTSEFC